MAASAPECNLVIEKANGSLLLSCANKVVDHDYQSPPAWCQKKDARH
jgi:hypothetical protein